MQNWFFPLHQILQEVLATEQTGLAHPLRVRERQHCSEACQCVPGIVMGLSVGHTFCCPTSQQQPCLHEITMVGWLPFLLFGGNKNI